MTTLAPNPGMLGLLAEWFHALGEFVRPLPLACARAGEQSVPALVEATGLGQADVSRHLQMLHTPGFATRRKEGLHVDDAPAHRLEALPSLTLPVPIASGLFFGPDPGAMSNQSLAPRTAARPIAMFPGVAAAQAWPVARWRRSGRSHTLRRARSTWPSVSEDVHGSQVVHSSGTGRGDRVARRAPRQRARDARG